MNKKNNLLHSITNPILAASGVWSESCSQLNDLVQSDLAGVVLKSCCLNITNIVSHNDILKLDNSLIVKSDLETNHGYQYMLNTLIKTNKHSNTKIIIFSINYENNENLEYILNNLKNKTNKTILVEINLNYKNDKYIIGYDLKKIVTILILLLKYTNTNIQAGLKLPPYLDEKIIERLSEIINIYNSIYFIVCNGSIPNIFYTTDNDYVFTTKTGYLSGKINKYISLNNVRLFNKYLNKDITIIGCGGIQSINDVRDYIKYGAYCVQIASHFYDEYQNKLKINEINNLIKSYMTNISKL